MSIFLTLHSVFVKQHIVKCPTWMSGQSGWRQGARKRRTARKNETERSNWTPDQGKNNYCTRGLHLANTFRHLDSFGPCTRTPTPSLHGCFFKHVLFWTHRRGARVHSPPNKQTEKRGRLKPMINSFSASVLFWSLSNSLPRSLSCFSFWAKWLWLSLHFSAPGNRAITPKKR